MTRTHAAGGIRNALSVPTLICSDTLISAHIFWLIFRSLRNIEIIQSFVDVFYFFFVNKNNPSPEGSCTALFSQLASQAGTKMEDTSLS